MTATMNIKRMVVSIVFALVAMGLFSSPALAYLNTWYDLSDYYSTDADVRMNGFRSPGTSYGYISINNYGRTACTYVQRKPVANLALDGDWKRSTPDVCGGTATYYWSDSTTLAYNAYAFRICKNVAYASDPCGTSRTIRPYS